MFRHELAQLGIAQGSNIAHRQRRRLGVCGRHVAIGRAVGRGRWWRCGEGGFVDLLAGLRCQVSPWKWGEGSLFDGTCFSTKSTTDPVVPGVNVPSRFAYVRGSILHWTSSIIATYITAPTAQQLLVVYELIRLYSVIQDAILLFSFQFCHIVQKRRSRLTLQHGRHRHNCLSVSP